MREIPFGRPWITEADRLAVAKVLDGHVLTHGPEGRAFEEEFATFLGDGAHCVTTSSCMAALHLAYLHFGVGPGDEVIVPAQTHVATAHAVEWVGATPVFVDCDPATGNMTSEAIEALVTPRTKAIGVVHFVGIPCDMPAIMAVAEKHGLKVIEDCALAVGARVSGVHVGLFGDAGAFSFYPVKHITTGEGGMFVTRHRDVAEAVGRLRAFGVDRSRPIPGIYDVPELGLNYRMSELQAALGRSQLRRIDEILDRRRANFEALKGALGDRHVLDGPGSSHYCLIHVANGGRTELQSLLSEAGIGTSIYYPHPVPRMGYYRQKYGYDAGRYPGAERLSDQGLALPVGPHVVPDEVAAIAGQVLSAVGGRR